MRLLTGCCVVWASTRLIYTVHPPSMYDDDCILPSLKLQCFVLFYSLTAGAHFFYLGASIFSRCMREPRYERRRNEPPPQRHQSEPNQKVEKTEAGEEPKEKKGWFGWGGNQNAEESDNERVYVEDSEQEEADAGMEAGQSGGTKNVTASL